MLILPSALLTNCSWGRCLSYVGTEGGRVWRNGLEQARAGEDPLFEGAFLDRLGMAASAAGDCDEAIELYKEAVEIARELVDRQGLKHRLYNQASVHLLMRQSDVAAGLADEAVGVARDLGDRRIECLALNALGEAELLLERPAEALARFQTSLAIAMDQEDHLLKARLLANAGLAYQAMGHFAMALNHLRRSQTVLAELGGSLDGEGVLLQLDNFDRLGRLVWEMGDPVAALAFHQSAAGVARSQGLEERAVRSERLRQSVESTLDSSPEGLKRARREGLERMYGRALAHGLDGLAQALERQLANLENGGQR